MDIQEIKESKRQLETDIYILLRDFKVKTKCDVTNIELEFLDTSAHGNHSELLSVVKIEVKI